jgi:hypothetical protein
VTGGFGAARGFSKGAAIGGRGFDGDGIDIEEVLPLVIGEDDEGFCS